MDEQAVIIGVAGEVRETLAEESSGHDWWHTHRVWKMAERLANGTAANVLIVQLAALLHDIADWKFHDGGETVGPASRDRCSINTVCRARRSTRSAP